ncbi:MAG: SIR2 family NAD-dependent protein deacylase [Promethearchaeota archaeon]
MENLQEWIKTTAGWIVNSNHVVIFTGAGLSTASGLSDFRGPDGIWTRRDKGLAPMPSKVSIDNVRPNAGHLAIVKLEKLGKVQFLISQNVDGLHLDSGFPAEKLAELHGNKNLMICLECEAKYTKSAVGWNARIHGHGYRTSRPRDNQPRCPACNGRIISSIVNFKDPLPEKDLAISIRHSEKLCDIMIVLGSSLVVNPAASLVWLAKKNGARIVINNKGETPYDNIADLLVPLNINDYFPAVVQEVEHLIGL